MKKFFIISLTLFILFGCGKKENPLTPNYGNINNAASANLPTIDSIIPANYGRIIDENGDSTDGIQSEIVVVFSDFMDTSTINKTNITLYNISDGSNVPLTIDYDAERKTAYITTDNFPDNTGFLFKITNGVHNLGGLPLDGNKNRKQDGAPYDNAIYAFYTGTDASVSSNIRTAPPKINSVSPGTTGGVPVNTPIVIYFSDGPVDTLTFTSLNLHLKENGTTVVTDSIASFSPDSVVVMIKGGDTLKRSTMYTFTIDGYKILAEPDTLGNTGATAYLRRLDTNGDGIISADEDSFYTWKFITQDFPGTDTVKPPHITGFGDHNSTYYLFEFNKIMDISTFTKENIRVFDNDGYVPCTFRVDMDSQGVKYYYDRKISGTAQGWVSMEVKDKYGNKLDGNGNGIGGEAGKDDWPSTPASVNIFWVTPPPDTMIVNQSYALSWFVSGGSYISQTNIQYGTNPSANNYSGNIFSGYPVTVFTDTITITSAGTWYFKIQVTNQDSTYYTTGISRTVLGDPYEPNDTYTSAYHIFNGDTLTQATIDPAGDHDWFFFTGQSGDSVIIDIDAQSIGSSMNSYIYLYDKDGTTILSSNDDYAGLPDSHIEYTLTSSGRFYIMVRDSGDPNVGGPSYYYHLSLNIQ